MDSNGILKIRSNTQNEVHKEIKTIEKMHYNFQLETFSLEDHAIFERKFKLNDLHFYSKYVRSNDLLFYSTK